MKISIRLTFMVAFMYLAVGFDLNEALQYAGIFDFFYWNFHLLIEEILAQ